MNYNKMDAKHYEDVDGMDGDGGDAAIADEDRCLSLPDLRRTKMDPAVDELPLRIPSGGEVSATSGLSVCRLSDPIARGETIWGGSFDGNYTAATIWVDQNGPAV